MKNTDQISSMEIITFEGQKYKTRYIHVKGFGDVTVATESLVHELIKDDKYTSSEAQAIDEGIFFYVEDKYLWHL